MLTFFQRKKITHCIFFLFCALTLVAQEDETQLNVIEFPKHQIELRHDNDFFVFTDRYYTTGSFITFRTSLKNGYFSNENEQLGFSIIHQYYTPANIHSADIEDFDRPYVGFLGLESGWSIANTSSFVDFNILIGLAGPAAAAEEFQNLFHSNGGIETPAWVGQINNSFHVNLTSSYTKEWKLNPNPFCFYLGVKPSLALGTKDLYFQQEAFFYFGKRSALQESSAYHQFQNLKKEFFLTFSAGYRYVHYNALLEGHPIGDSSVFIVEPEQNLLLLRFDFVYNTGRNKFKITQNYNTSETKTVKSHLTFGITIARSF